MPTVTLETVKAEQAKLAAMIAQLEHSAVEPVAYVIDEAEISLAPGEHYAGIVLDEDGDFSHHLVLLPGDAADITWDKALVWADQAGGDLPTRQEQALLYANLKGKFEAARYWSREPHAGDGSYAWGQHFYTGYQYDNHKSYEGRARAVRRVTA